MTIPDPTTMREAEYTYPAPPPRARSVGPARPGRMECARGAILVVDDDSSIATLLADLLESAGYDVYTASNGKNGLIIARAIHPALVLTDYQMPELDGKQVIRALRASPGTCDIPAVLMSSTRPRESALRGVPFLPKPFNIEEVLGLVERCLGGPFASAHGQRQGDA